MRGELLLADGKAFAQHLKKRVLVSVKLSGMQRAGSPDGNPASRPGI